MFFRNNCGRLRLASIFSTLTIGPALAQDGLAKLTLAACSCTFGQPSLTLKSPLIVNTRPVFSVAMRVIGPRSQFQSKTSTAIAIRRTKASKRPTPHFKKRGMRENLLWGAKSCMGRIISIG